MLIPQNKPENVLRSTAALQSLHELILSKCSRNAAVSSLKPIMLRFISLCVDLRKGKMAKEALYQYKNIAQNTSVGTVEVVLKKFIELVEEKVSEAQVHAEKLVLDTIDDLEASETPESIILSTVSGDQSKDRADRAVYWQFSLARRVIIEHRKELVENMLIYKEKEAATKRAQKLQQEQEAEQRRVAEEAKKREAERIKKETDAIRAEEARKLADELKAKGALKVDVDDLEGLDTSKLRAIQLEQLEKETRDLNEKLRITSKRIDHLERAYRKEELPLLQQKAIDQLASDKLFHEKARKLQLEALKAIEEENKIKQEEGKLNQMAEKQKQKELEVEMKLQRKKEELQLNDHGYDRWMKKERLPSSDLSGDKKWRPGKGSWRLRVFEQQETNDTHSSTTESKLETFQKLNENKSSTTQISTVYRPPAARKETSRWFSSTAHRQERPRLTRKNKNLQKIKKTLIARKGPNTRVSSTSCKKLAYNMPITETNKTIESIFKETQPSPEITHTSRRLSAYNPVNTPSCRTADYLEHKLNQLVHSEQNEDSDVCMLDSEKKEIGSSSNTSLLTMFLTSPLRTAHQESLGLDLLSDHGSTSGYSTPTPPLLLHFPQRPSVKFAVSTAAPRVAAHEFIHELPPILQSSCFPHGLHTDPVIERSQHHVRFQTAPMNNHTGILMRPDRLDRFKEESVKPTTKILLDQVFPREKINFIMPKIDQQGELGDSDLEGSDDLETSLEDLEQQRLQTGIKKMNTKHCLFESTSYQSIILPSYDPLKKYLMPSIDDINPSSQKILLISTHIYNRYRQIIQVKNIFSQFSPKSVFSKFSKRLLWIQSEATPNKDAIKFIPGINILPDSFSSIEYLNSDQAAFSPLAKKLFSLDGVKYVFYGPNYITVTKHPENAWNPLKPEIFSIIMEHISSGQPLFLPQPKETFNKEIQEEDSEVVYMIKELIETRIRTAIQEDGGDVEYKGFHNGKVFLKLKGACKTCSSSVVTLKNGIESMLMHYIPDVKGVEHVIDEDEEIGIKEFENLERKIKLKL
ncbi:hypothetical protein PCK1_000961 [Pneumocystis canis]|nr:hypothetical protein PCK1_000961 [Pneumocystis canis]